MAVQWQQDGECFGVNIPAQYVFLQLQHTLPVRSFLIEMGSLWCGPLVPARG